MKKIIGNKKGVTLLEGLIALLLLAMVATSTFAVLLSSSRKSEGPDIREEMALAVDRASNLLQTYIYANNSTFDSTTMTQIQNGLCPSNPDLSPLSAGTHAINCLLPPICDASNNNSSFSYTVGPKAFSDLSYGQGKDTSVAKSGFTVTFNIQCNGYSL